MNRLWVRLTLAFALVVLVAVGVAPVLTFRQANSQFRHYFAQSGFLAEGGLV